MNFEVCFKIVSIIFGLLHFDLHILKFLISVDLFILMETRKIKLNKSVEIQNYKYAHEF